MKRRIPYPQEEIQIEFLEFIEKTYGNREFPQFEAANLFFKHVFNTDYDLNDFKNMPHVIKDAGDFEYVGEKKNPRSNRLNNYYRLKIKEI